MNKVAKPFREHEPQSPENEEKESEYEKTCLDYRTLEECEKHGKRETDEANS